MKLTEGDSEERKISVAVSNGWGSGRVVRGVKAQEEEVMECRLQRVAEDDVGVMLVGRVGREII